MRFMNNSYNYADFAVARKKVKAPKATENPFSNGTSVRSQPMRQKVQDARALAPITEGRVKLDKKVAPGKMQRALRQVGRFAMKNKVGVGLAAAGALGAAGVAGVRKMRSDKGKKRGGYNG